MDATMEKPKMHEMGDAQAEEYISEAAEKRKGWTKTATATVEKDGGESYRVELVGPQNAVREGCAASLWFNTLGEAISGAQDYCDARGIRITGWNFEGFTLS